MKVSLLISLVACCLVAGTAAGHECLDYPPLVGSVDTPGTAFAICIRDTYAYVADGPGGLQVVDISTPTSPQVVGSAGTPHDATDVYAAGGFAFVAAGDSVHVIDVSIPAAPQIVGSVGLPDQAYGVTVSGNYAYVAADWFGGLQVVDVSTPSSPTVVGSYDDYGEARDVAFSDGFVYVAYPGAGMAVIDVTTPTTPVLVDVLIFPGLISTNRITVAGSYAYVCSGNTGSLRIVDISSPAAPFEVAGVPAPINASDAAFVGDRVFVASWAIHVVDVTDRSNPRTVGTVKAGDAVGVAVSGDYCYTACLSNGVQVHLISDPPSSPFLDRIGVDDEAVGIDVAEQLCYVVDSGNGLKIVDVSDPSNLEVVGSDANTAYASDVSVSGGFAYVASNYFGLKVVDVSTPTNPQCVGTADTPGWTRDVALAGSYAYVADGNWGLQVIDVQTPSSPVIVGNADTPGDAGGVAVDAAKGYAFVADWDNLQIVDIQSPANPQIVASAAAYQAMDVALYEDHAYVACNALGLSIVDVSTPASPGPVATVDPISSYAKRVYVTGDRAYVAWVNWGVYVFDVTTPLDPQAIGFFSTAVSTRDVAVVGPHCFVAGGEDGLATLMTPCYPPTGVKPQRTGGQVTLLPAYPNPFNPTTTIRFYLQEPSPVSVTVFDAVGRRVTSLVGSNTPMSAGAHEIVWDGTNDRGQTVASGSYFYKLVTRWGNENGRMVLVK